MDLQLTAKTVNQQRDRRLPPGRWSRLRRVGAPLRPSRTMVRLGYPIAAWGGVFAAVHFYWAAGGTALNNGGPVNSGAAAYIAFIAILGIIGGLIGLAIARGATRRIPRRPLLLLTRVGATLLLFGVAIAAIRLAAGTDDSWTKHPLSTAAITVYFLAGGVLYALAARAIQRADTTTARPAVPRPDRYIRDRHRASGSPRRAAHTPPSRHGPDRPTTPLLASRGDARHRQLAFGAAAWALLFAAQSLAAAIIVSSGSAFGADAFAADFARMARQGDAGFIAALWLAVAAKALGGMLALAPMRRRGQQLPRGALTTATYTVGALVLLYGVVNLTESVLMKTGTSPVPHSLGAHALSWHLWLWDPYWILGGLLFLAAARAGTRPQPPAIPTAAWINKPETNEVTH